MRVASLMVLIKQVDSEVPCEAFSEIQSILNTMHIQLSTIIVPEKPGVYCTPGKDKSRSYHSQCISCFFG